MNILIEGHRYMLQNFEDKTGGQELQFIQKVPTHPGSTDLQTVSDGTTNEEVLAMLIDRLSYLQAKFPCRENALVITKLEESLMWLNERTRKRQDRRVEGKQIA
jgi:hypothetical protein